MIPLHRQALFFGLLVAACHAPGPGVPLPAPPAPPAPGVAASDTACTITAGRAAGRDTVTIALTEPVDASHAPVPRNDAERWVFGQLYETLMRVDCQGRVLAGLAKSWEQGARDRWTFTLRDDARFWDGAPVTARDVLAAWRLRDSVLAQASAIVSDRVLSVPAPATPFQPFADPRLAVTKPAPGGSWPIGTGGHWVTGGGERGAADMLWAAPLPKVALPVLRLTMVAPNGARDALDEGADLLVTDDAAALEYAAARPEYVDALLGWTRTYVLLSPGRDPPGVAALRIESLRQAVHGDARSAEESDGGHAWFTELGQCDLLPARDPIGAQARRHRVVYNQTDRSAADLAARLVALGVLGRGAVATGLAPTPFEAALRAGTEGAYVLRLRRRVFDFCRAALELPPWSSAGTIEPLVDVRSHALVRRGFPRLTVDWSGTTRLLPR